MADVLKDVLKQLDKGENPTKTSNHENSGCRTIKHSASELQATTYGLRAVNESADSINGKNKK